MKKLSSREKIYMGIFAVTLVWGVWNFQDTIFGEPEKGKATTSVTPQPALPAAATGNILRAGISADQAYTPPEWNSDPFHRQWRNAQTRGARASSKTGPRSYLRLSAVVIRSDARYAVINGHILQEGQFFEGRRVVRIWPSKVHLHDNGTEVTLEL